MKQLQKCFDFCLTNDKLVVWSNEMIFHGDLSLVNSNTETITLDQSPFEVYSKDEAWIQSITSRGQNKEDKANGNYYIYIKIIVENSYSFMLKYNLLKSKEFASFDCDKDA